MVERLMTSIDTEELSEYIRSIIEAAKHGTKDTDFYVDGTIDIELAVVNTKKAEGGIKIFIAGAKGEYSNDTTSKIKISLRQQQGVGFVNMGSDR